MIGFITDAQNSLSNLAQTSAVSTGEEDDDPCIDICFDQSSIVPRNDILHNSKDLSIDDTSSCNEFCAMPIDFDSNTELNLDLNENTLGPIDSPPFEYNYIYNKMQSLLARHPYMKDIRTFSKVAGIPKRVQRILKTGLGRKMTMTPETLTKYKAFTKF